MIYKTMMRLARDLVTGRTSVGIGGAVTFLVFSVTSGFADEWPPSLDQKNPTTESLDGRTVERYIHGRRESWGYASAAHDEWSYPAPPETGAAQQNRNSFYAVAPKYPRENAPLYVFDDFGQANAYFQWKNEQDMPSGFTMQHRIVRPVVKNSPTAMPDTATMDVTLRRLQKFKVKSGRNYTWQVIQDGHVVRSGRVQLDVANLLTMINVLVTATPLEIIMKAPEENISNGSRRHRDFEWCSVSEHRTG